MRVLQMPPRNNAACHSRTEPPNDLLTGPDDPAMAATNAAGAAGLADEIIELVQTAMVGPQAELLPLDAIAAQVYALSITIAASDLADADVADTLARAASALRLGVERCRRTIAEDLAAWPPR